MRRRATLVALAPRTDGHDALHPRAFVLFFIRSLLRGLPGRLDIRDEVIGIDDVIIGNSKQVVYGGGDLPGRRLPWGGLRRGRCWCFAGGWRASDCDSMRGVGGRLIRASCSICGRDLHLRSVGCELQVRQEIAVECYGLARGKGRIRAGRARRADQIDS